MVVVFFSAQNRQHVEGRIRALDLTFTSLCSVNPDTIVYDLSFNPIKKGLRSGKVGE